MFFNFLHIYIELLFGTKSHYTILSNYLIFFKVDAEMSEIFTDFSRGKYQKNSAH